MNRVSVGGGVGQGSGEESTGSGVHGSLERIGSLVLGFGRVFWWYCARCGIVGI